MLDIKLIRSDKDKVIEALSKRNGEFPIEEIIELDEKRREIITNVEAKKAEQNQVSKSIPELKKSGQDVAPIFAQMKELSQEIKNLDEELRVLDENIKTKLLYIPNLPNPEVPLGKDDSDNV